MAPRRLLPILLIGLLLFVARGGALAQDGGPTTAGGPAAPATALGPGFSYNGRLFSGGAGVTGNCDFEFGLWDAATAGGQLGVTQTVTSLAVNAGLFTATLNGGAEFGGNAFDGDARWLAIALRCPAGGGNFTHLSPRQALLAAPYALYAVNAGSADVALSALSADAAPWNGLTGVPAGFADGTDDVGGGAAGWQLAGNGITGTEFLGTTNNMTLTLAVSGTTGLRLGPTSGTPNVVGGYDGNWVGVGVVGATIGGGGLANQAHSVTGNYATIGGGRLNRAENIYATVGGGDFNRANGDYATVAGGWANTASGTGATVGGGGCLAGLFIPCTSGNVASGAFSTVDGGYRNVASGTGATVGGGGKDDTHPNMAGNAAAGAASTIGGGIDNSIPSAGGYATIGGGLSNTASGAYATISGGYNNTAIGDYATISGGENNTAYGHASIGGGLSNIAGGAFATVGGGAENLANGAYATVAGGRYSDANGNYSFAAGRNAHALHTGSFVWADSNTAPISSTVNNQFLVRASGGVTMYTNSGASAGVAVYPGSGSWTSASDRNAKANFAPVDGVAILNTLAGIPIETWNYNTQDAAIRHMGPMAQDFYAAFGLGEGETTISVVDADGVALAAIQGLYSVVQAKESRIAALEARLRAVETAGAPRAGGYGQLLLGLALGAGIGVGAFALGRKASPRRL